MNRKKLLMLVSGIMFFSSMFAQDRGAANDKLSADRRNAVTKAVEKVSPAVVGINVSGVQRFNNPYYRYFFGDQVVQELGSGVIISPDGFILTNDHVANKETTTQAEITVTLTDGTHHKANIIGADKFSDICLLKINAGKPLPYVELGTSADLLIGEWVVALGNPFGLFDINDKPTVTVGVISSTGMNMGRIDGRAYVDMIQTDAAINPGNSGGPLVNINGELIGLNSLIRGSNEGVQANIGLGFAIPVDKIKKIITELKEKGEIDRNYYTGIYYQNITDDVMRYYKLPTTKGAIITDVEKNSPAAKAGLQRFDIIVQVGKYKTSNVEYCNAVFLEYRTGDIVPIKILRGKETLTKNMKLERIKND